MTSPPQLPSPEEHSLSPRSHGVGEWLVRHRWALFIVALALTALAWRPSQQLDLDESIESFFAEDDPHLLAYQRSKRDFGGDEFVMVGYRQPGLLEDEPDDEDDDWVDPMRELKRFADELSTVPGVNSESTQSLPTMLLPPALGWAERKLFLNTVGEEPMINLSRRVLIGDDNESTAVVLRLLPESDTGPSRQETFRQIREIAAGHKPPAYVAGEPVQVHDMFRFVEDDSLYLGLWSTALLMTVILVFFRSLRWTLLPVMLVNLVLIWTQALLYVSRLKLSMVSSMLRSLVTIIGIATVMHITVCYRDHRRSLDRGAAFRATFSQLARPILWTTVTTSIGFVSLLSSEITPVRSFGLMMGLATLLVIPACLLLLPGGILNGKFDADPRAVPGEAKISRGLAALSRLTERFPWPIGLTSLLVMAFAGWGLTRLSVETDFSKNFRSESEIVQAISFFEDNLGGVGTWDVSFDAPETLDVEFIDKVRELAAELRALRLEDGTALTKVVAVSDGVDLVPGTLGIKIAYLNRIQPEFMSSLYNPDPPEEPGAEQATPRMRIVLRGLERQPAEVKLRLIAAVEEITRRHFPEADARAAGLYVLLANLITSLLGDQLVSFCIAGAGICVTMAIAFRSLRIGLISIVPNAFPIILLIGSLGWMSIPINIGTAMIASVSMGLTVDSSIHYLTAYRACRRQGSSHADAIQQAHGTVGFVLVLANVALVLGFTVLATSHFIPLVYFGVLVSLAMLGGLIGNLLLLPLLLKLARL